MRKYDARRQGLSLDLVLGAVTALMGFVTGGLSTIAAAVIALCDAIMIVDFFHEIYYACKSVTAIARHARH